MMKSGTGITAFCLFALTSLAVAQDAPPESPGLSHQAMPAIPGTIANPRDEKMTTNVPTLNEADRTFITRAAIGGMFEVQSSQLATTAAQSGSVKEFARKMLEDHTAANNELKKLAAVKHVSVPATMDVKHTKIMAQLAQKESSDFDKAYIAAQLAAHEEAITLFETASTTATDPQVKAFAAKTLPTLQHHKKMVEELAEDSDKTN